MPRLWSHRSIRQALRILTYVKKLHSFILIYVGSISTNNPICSFSFNDKEYDVDWNTVRTTKWWSYASRYKYIPIKFYEDWFVIYFLRNGWLTWMTNWHDVVRDMICFSISKMYFTTWWYASSRACNPAGPANSVRNPTINH